MPDKVRIKVEGHGEIEAFRVPITSSSENFNTYLLEDGVTLRMKVVVMEALRAVDAKDKNGKPLYMVRSQNILDTQHPAGKP